VPLRLGSAALAFVALALAAPAQATVPIGPQFRVSQTGPDGDASFDATAPAVAYNTQTNQYLIVWSGSTATAGELEIWGRLVDAAGNPLGATFRISDMGPDGNGSYDAYLPAVTYNTQANEYLVVWGGDDDTFPFVDEEFEIFGQRVSATGTQLGLNDFRLSDMGTSGTTVFSASNPVAAYNSQANEYLVVWYGDDDVGALVDDELEIFGQRLSALGMQVGTNDFRLSDMGPNGSTLFGAFNPVTTYNSQANEYLVVWWGDDDTGSLVDNEFEIFGQRVSTAGAHVGANDFRISDMGPDSSTTFRADDPAVSYGANANEYLVAWEGEDVTDDDLEIFGQRLSGTATPVGANDFRISDLGLEGSTSYPAYTPALAHNGQTGEYVVTWEGVDVPLANGESEIYGQLLSPAGAELDLNDFRISQMGPDGSADFDATNTAVAFGGTLNEFLVVWQGDTDAPLVDQEFEIWARRLGVPTQPPPPAGACTITGTPGNDVLTGTAGPDRICALGGNDRVFGRGGDDRIVLGPGRDRAFGGAGRDVILGGRGPDRISGGGGRDRLFGERGRDVLLARDRVRDLVHGGKGFDRARVDRRRDVRRSVERLF
jgi:Ca2+-binding RTX toxin-like protein